MHALLCILLLAITLPEQEKVNQASQVFQDFGRRVSDYLKLQKSVRSQMHGLKPTQSPEEIEHHERELAHGIRKARTAARQGDIFTPGITAEFRRLIAETMQGPEAARIRESLRSGAPVAPQALQVNASYPPAMPLQSTPPSLLKNLPALPTGLDYRVVGQTLILRDTEANVIVDFIPNVIS